MIKRKQLEEKYVEKYEEILDMFLSTNTINEMEEIRIKMVEIRDFLTALKEY